MKKNYLVPKSETLMAILMELCSDPNPTFEPTNSLVGSATESGGIHAPRIQVSPSHGI